ncbi:MAG: tetratricopeptide repeat protein [Saprospiraceae bacterium]
MKKTYLSQWTFLLTLIFMSTNLTISIAQQKEQSDSKQVFASLEQKLKDHNHLTVEARIALYHQLKKESPALYDFKEDKELNQYGYSLLFGGKPKEALEIFKLLVTEFPDRSNPYDSLGEAYLKNGNEKLALLNYEKSFELDPKNKGAAYQIDFLKGNFDVLIANDSFWGKEIFVFPIHFAEDIPYEGVEDARFPKYWAKPDSSDFWSYVIGWNIVKDQVLPVAELEESWEAYFNGLMAVVNKEKNKVLPKTNANFTKTESKDGVISYAGTVLIFDAFTTKQPLLLNVQFEQHFCSKKGKAELVFWFSPKNFEHAIWKKLKTVQLLPKLLEGC